MFRQRLKGGHRVGSNSTGSCSQNASSKLCPQSVGPNSSQTSSTGIDGAWNWGDSTVVHHTQTSFSIPQPTLTPTHSDQEKIAKQKTLQPNTFGQNPPHSAEKNNAGSFLPRNQSQAQNLNGADPQNQLDDWNWESEDNWGDWGSSDVATDLANNNRKQKQQQLNQQQQINQHQQQQQINQHQQQPVNLHRQQQKQDYDKLQQWQQEDNLYKYQPMQVQNSYHQEESQQHYKQGQHHYQENAQHQPEELHQLQKERESQYHLQDNLHHYEQHHHQDQQFSYLHNQQQQQHHNQEQVYHYQESQHQQHNQEKVHHYQESQHQQPDLEELHQQKNIQHTNQEQIQQDLDQHQQHQPQSYQCNQYQEHQQMSYDFYNESGDSNSHSIQHHLNFNWPSDDKSLGNTEANLPETGQNLNETQMCKEVEQKSENEETDVHNQYRTYPEVSTTDEIQFHSHSSENIQFLINQPVERLDSIENASDYNSKNLNQPLSESPTAQLASALKLSSNFRNQEEKEEVTQTHAHSVEEPTNSNQDKWSCWTTSEWDRNFSVSVTSTNDTWADFSLLRKQSKNGSPDQIQDSEASQSECKEDYMLGQNLNQNCEYSSQWSSEFNNIPQLESNERCQINQPSLSLHPEELESNQSSEFHIADSRTDYEITQQSSSHGCEISNVEPNFTEQYPDSTGIDEYLSDDWNWEKERLQRMTKKQITEGLREACATQEVINSSNEIQSEMPPSHHQSDESGFEAAKSTTSNVSDIKSSDVTKVPNDASNPPVASWDDEWGDGWEAKPQEQPSREMTPEQDPHSVPVHFADVTARLESLNLSGEYEGYPSNTDDVTNRAENYIEKKERYVKVRGISAGDSVSEVSNIKVLNQELQGIFSVPSDTSLVLSFDTQGSQQDIQIQSAQATADKVYSVPCFTSNSSIRNGESDSNILCKDIKSMHKQVYDEASMMAESDDDGPTINFGKPQEETPAEEEASRRNSCFKKKLLQAVTDEELIRSIANVHVRDETTMDAALPKPLSQYPLQPLALSLSSRSSASANSRPSSYPSAHVQDMWTPSSHSSIAHSRPSSNHSAHTQSKEVIMEPKLCAKAVEETSCASSSTKHSDVIAAPLSSLSGPSGSIQTLHARKGSPFQPPVNRRSSAGNAELSSQSAFVQNAIKNGDRNPLLIDSNPPDSVVKLSVASPDQLNPIDNDSTKPEPANNVPLVVPGLLKVEPSMNDVSNQSPIPPAPLSSLTAPPKPPKVHTLNPVANTLTSPSFLDLSQVSVKSELNETPSFSRMIPGESTKGESTTIVPPPPSVPPAMPSGRVVTGNANPQPVPNARVKQDIRSPPDGPDTGSFMDNGPNVVPPVRSETIGSEGHGTRLPHLDRRDDKDGRIDREPWDRDRDYYPDRYRERNREGRDYYRGISPSLGRRPQDRDYEDRHRHQRETDEEDDNDDDRNLMMVNRDRRNRAYQDELDRYTNITDGDQGFRRERDRRRAEHRDREYRYSQDDDDPYFEGRSTRSRPTSRSSSYGNVDTESSQERSSHREDYYERSLRVRDRDRARDRDYNRYRKREGKEQDPYARAYNPYPDQFGSREMYDPQSYYYYYQNYQKYLQQHPYYREYYRQYYSRYGYPAGGESLVDDKASTRSGRSSVNDDMKKSSVSSRFRLDFMDHPSVGNCEPSPVYPETDSFGYKAFTSGDISGIPSMTDEGRSDALHRKSPHLFTGPHLRASFTPGGKLILVLPNDPKEEEKATVQMRNVQKMLSIDAEFTLRIQKMKAYPGPLTVAETHKDVILRYCEEKAKEAMGCTALQDKESAVLIWDYLSLLVKQNGNVCGADLAKLLVKGRISSQYSSLQEEDKLNEIDSIHSETNDQEQTMSVNGQPSVMTGGCSNEAHIQKFTEYLCLGMKREAVDYAIREGLWGYAMTLAAKMDSITHARVMAAFINSIPSTDVLQTLIQHLSGKKPEVTKSYSMEKWGDWRQHLAMLVSNPTGNPQRDRASIISLGDALASKQRLHAAHICYLAAEVEWGTFSNKESKLVLIGSSPRQPFQLFASEDAIQCTEIYEFAKAHDTSNPSFFTFQSYKFIYALRLAECGFPNEALKYCEVISQAVMKQPSSFEVEFVSQIFELALQLKFHDVHYQVGEGEMSDMPDPEWLRSLQAVLHSLQYQAAETRRASAEAIHQPVVKNEMPSRLSVQDSYSGDNSSVVSPEYTHYGIRRESEPGSDQKAVPDSAVHHDAISETNFSNIGNNILQYEGRAHAHENVAYESLPATLSNDSVLSYDNSAPPSLAVSDGTSPNPQPPANYPSWHQPQQHWEPEASIPANQSSTSIWQQKTQIKQEHWQADGPTQHLGSQNYQPNQQPTHFQPPQQYHSWERPVEGTNQQQHQFDGGIDSHSAGQNQRGNAIQDASGSHSPTVTERSPEEEEYWAVMSGKDNRNLREDTLDASVKEEPPKPKQEDENETKTGDKKSSFLGSLFGGWRKASNQAKLPDDKDPSIVWDEKKKKWVNKDASDSEDAPPPPPPSDLAGAPPPSLNTMRGGVRKSRYVDPVGEMNRTKPSASPLPNLMANAPLPSKTPPFQSQQQQQQQPLEASQVPAHNFSQPDITQSGSRMQAAQSNLPLLQSSENQDVDPDTVDSIPMMTPGASQAQPMFFNPAQFRHPQNSAASQPKRTGPARRTFTPQR